MEAKDIELRSEKVRHIIGKIPPLLVRSGILVVAVLVAALLIIAWCIPYPENLRVMVEVRSENEVVGHVPYSYITQLKENMPVEIAFEGYDARIHGYIKGRIRNINKEVEQDGNLNYFSITIQPFSSMEIEMKERMRGEAFILLSNKSILKHIWGEVLSD